MNKYILGLASILVGSLFLIVPLTASASVSGWGNNFIWGHNWFFPSFNFNFSHHHHNHHHGDGDNSGSGDCSDDNSCGDDPGNGTLTVVTTVVGGTAAASDF